MINQFFATFIPGLQNLIADIVKERLSDVRILKLLDGAALFETEISYDKLNFFCFNNIFAAINVLDCPDKPHTEQQGCGEIYLEKHIKMAIKGNSEFNTDIIANNSKTIKSFRIVISNENVPAAIDENLRTEAENAISGISGLSVNRSSPDTEFWFLYRSEENPAQRNFSIFMKRLTLRASWDKTLHKGELPPPLAWTLCRMASLSNSDTVLDPFCGYGSIPEAAMRHFHITDFVACDNDRQAVSFAAERFKNRKISSFNIHNSDFTKLPWLISEKSVDAIVTDPPWGKFREISDASFHKKMFDVFSRMLKNGGRAAVLYANDGNFIKASEEKFLLRESIPILLSGRKAVIYAFVKR